MRPDLVLVLVEAFSSGSPVLVGDDDRLGALHRRGLELQVAQVAHVAQVTQHARKTRKPPALLEPVGPVMVDRVEGADLAVLALAQVEAALRT